MDVLDSALKPEISKVLNAPKPRVFNHWTAVLHCGNENIKPMYVDEVNLMRNYAKSFGENLSITLTIPEGDFNFMVYPNREKLQITLKQEPLHSGTGFVKNRDDTVKTKRYNAVLMDQRSSVIEQNSPTVASRQTANRMNFIRVQIQLVDPILDYIRKSTFGATFRQTTGATALRAFLGYISQTVTEGTERRVSGVDVCEGFNPKVIEQCTVPHQTPMEKVPLIIDQESGGIYPTGMRYFLQEDHWFIYPIYDIRRYDKSARVVNLINVPRGRLTGIETSYRQTQNQVIILATGEAKQFDPSQALRLQEGNAVRYIDAVQLFDDGITQSGNKSYANPDKTISEITVDPMGQNTDMAKLSEKVITARHYQELSKLAERSGFYIQLEWENANADVIYPGMAAKYSYLNGRDQVEELYGCVVGIQTRHTPTTNNPVERMFSCKAAITLFLERNVKERK